MSKAARHGYSVPSSTPALRLSALAIGLAFALSAQAQTATDAPASSKQAKELETVVVTGSRAKGHTVADSLAPIDVIDSTAIASTGALEVGQLLQKLEPSFNFSRTFISDGTDIIRPATLRGLGPDQVLILVNGKRRHQQALVNVQQTIGRGSAGTDINAIPVSAIERIEVLRDGAAAQYGSDAISGVINIILKKNTDETRVSLETGQTYQGDGDVVHGGLNTGFKLGAEGYLNLTAEYRNRQETNRAGPDVLRVNPPRVTQRIGDSDAEDKYLWFNSAIPLSGGELYAFGGFSRREGDSSGFFRSAGDGRTVPALYPNGFLPNIITTVKDGSVAVGYRAPINDHWDFDVSINQGRSEFDFHERNSVNVSWWYEPKPGGGIFAESPTAADTGTLKYEQTTFNADLRGDVDWGVGAGPLYIGTGVEWRRDNYEIEAGDPVSYTYGRTNDPSIPIFDQTGGFAAPGMQGFPGFTPGTEVDRGRHNVSIYGDAESQMTEKLLLGAALRYEDYSDFGSTVTGKFSGRFQFTEKVALRGAIATGFRAPGVQQAFYSQVSTNLNANGVLTDTLTARQDSDVTRAFGIKPLKEENSNSGSLGLTYAPNDRTSLTVDLFRITIRDRIVFSSNIAPEDASTCGVNNAGCPIRAILDPFKVGQAQFFTNAINTRTTGVDIVFDRGFDLSSGGTFDFSAAVNFNKTEVTKRKSQSALLAPNVLFDDTQVTLIERGQPRQHATLTGTWNKGAWTTILRGNYYGAVEGQGFTPGFIQRWDGKWLGDASVKYAFSSALDLTIGIDNMFDTKPEKWDPVNAFPFPQLGFTHCWETCPFGINGGFYYARLNYVFKH